MVFHALFSAIFQIFVQCFYNTDLITELKKILRKIKPRLMTTVYLEAEAGRGQIQGLCEQVRETHLKIGSQKNELGKWLSS